MHNILVREKGKEMAEDDDHLELGTLLKRKVHLPACSTADLYWCHCPAAICLLTWQD